MANLQVQTSGDLEGGADDGDDDEEADHDPEDEDEEGGEYMYSTDGEVSDGTYDQSD